MRWFVRVRGSLKFRERPWKGAIREAAQRILGCGVLLYEPTKVGQPWLLSQGRLQRLFACEHRPSAGPAAHYKFNGAVGTAGSKVSRSSTAIDYQTGTAKDESLRTLQYWAKGIDFPVSITGRNGNWGSGGVDDADLLFLLAAIHSVEAVGGDQATGNGCVTVENLLVTGGLQLSKDDLLTQFANFVPESA